MRQNLAFSWLLALLPLFSAGQPRSEYFFHQSVADIVPRMLAAHPGGHFVTGNAKVPGIDGCETHRLHFWDAAFEPTAVDLPDNGAGWQLYPLAGAWQGDTFMVLGALNCSPFQGTLDGFSALLAYSKSGELLWQSSWPNCDFLWLHFAAPPAGNSCALLDFDEAGLLYVALDEGLFYFPQAADLPVAAAEGLQLSGLVGLAALPGQRMAVCSAEEVRLLDLEAEEQLWSAPVAALSMTALGEALWFASADSLYRLGADLAPRAWALPEEARSPLKMAVQEGQPLLYEYYDNPVGMSYQGWRFDEADEAFTLVFDWPSQTAEVLAIAPSGTDSCYLSGWRKGRPFLKQTAFDDFQFVSEADLGVAELSIDIMDVEVIPLSGGLFDYSIDFAMAAAVENYGPQRVHAFQFDWLRFGAWCFSPAIKIFEGIDLAPGERLLLSDTLRYFGTASLEALTERGLLLRFAAYAPNHYLDADMDNDTAFYSLVVSALPERPTAAAEVRLFPNPAHGALQVETSLPLQGFELYDGLGRLQRRGVLDNVTAFELPRQGLPAGVYVLRLSAQHSQMVRRVVWTGGARR
jgi:hypothetical protein